MRRKIDVSERDDRSLQVGLTERIEKRLEVRIAQPKEQSSEVQRFRELFPEFRFPRMFVRSEGRPRDLATGQGRVRDRGGQLGAPHAGENAPAGEGLHLGRRIAHQEDSILVASGHGSNRDARHQVAGGLWERCSVVRVHLLHETVKIDSRWSAVRPSRNPNAGAAGAVRDPPAKQPGRNLVAQIDLYLIRIPGLSANSASNAGNISTGRRSRKLRATALATPSAPITSFARTVRAVPSDPTRSISTPSRVADLRRSNFHPVDAGAGWPA